MKNHKILSIIIVALVALLAVGCGSPAAQSESGPLRIALVASNPVTDQSFAQTMYQGLLAVQEEMGEDQMELAYSENMFKVPDATAAIRDYASQGYDIIIAHSALFGVAVKEVAPDFPEVTFAWGPSTDTFTADGIENVFAYRVKVEEGGYVMGVISALLTETGVIGVCGPVEASDAKLYVESYQAGAVATDPDVDVKIIWTGSFTDVTLMATAAETLIQEDADVLTGIAAAIGCMNVAAEQGVNYFAVQGDWSSLAPETVVASAAYDWVGTLKQIIAENQNGNLGGEAFFLTIENGGLDLVYNDQISLSQEMIDAATAAAEGIGDGSINPVP